MARSGLQESISVLDPLQSWNWDVLIPRIPGADDTRPLTYKCLSTSIPGSNIEPVELPIHGVTLRFAGRRTWTGSWEATFVESRDSNTRGLLLNWMEIARSWKNNTGSYKSIYAQPVELTLYDDLPQVSRSIKLINAWPSAIGDLALDQTSAVIQYAITFTFDYTEEA